MTTSRISKIIYSTILGTCLLTASNASLAKTKEPITFRGISLGKKDARAELRNLCLSDKRNKEFSHSCDFNSNKNSIWVDYGNLPYPIAWITTSETGALEEVEIMADTAPLLELAHILEEKYGPAKKTSNTIKNRLGQNFDQKKFVWTDHLGNQIEILSIFYKIDSGLVTIKSASHIKKKRKNREAYTRHK